MGIETIKEIAEIENGPTKTIKMKVVSNGDEKVYLDIRQWVNTPKYSGPTKKGVWLDWDTVNSIIDGKLLEKAREAMDNG